MKKARHSEAKIPSEPPGKLHRVVELFRVFSDLSRFQRNLLRESHDLFFHPSLPTQFAYGQ
jgi:hypothetical protein